MLVKPRGVESVRGGGNFVEKRLFKNPETRVAPEESVRGGGILLGGEKFLDHFVIFTVVPAYGGRGIKIAQNSKTRVAPDANVRGGGFLLGGEEDFRIPEFWGHKKPVRPLGLTNILRNRVHWSVVIS